jgi:hypothetical protein
MCAVACLENLPERYVEGHGGCGYGEDCVSESGIMAGTQEKVAARHRTGQPQEYLRVITRSRARDSHSHAYLLLPGDSDDIYDGCQGSGAGQACIGVYACGFLSWKMAVTFALLLHVQHSLNHNGLGVR